MGEVDESRWAVTLMADHGCRSEGFDMQPPFLDIYRGYINNNVEIENIPLYKR